MCPWRSFNSMHVACTKSKRFDPAGECLNNLSTYAFFRLSEHGFASLEMRHKALLNKLEHDTLTIFLLCWLQSCPAPLSLAARKRLLSSGIFERAWCGACGLSCVCDHASQGDTATIVSDLDLNDDRMSRCVSACLDAFGVRVGCDSFVYASV
jgi:hypothetical protein